MIFPVFSCSHLGKFLSDPITKQRAMSKRVQESNLKEGSEVAKPKPMNLNFSTMRKILSQEVRDPNSPENQSLDPRGVPARSWKHTRHAESTTAHNVATLQQSLEDRLVQEGFGEDQRRTRRRLPLVNHLLG